MRAKTDGGTLEALRRRRDQILQVAAAHGGSNLRVFGSVARNEDDEESDVDLLVDFDEKVDALEYFARQDRLLQALSGLLGVKVDVTDAGGLAHEHFRMPSEEKARRRILAEAVPL